MIPWHRLFGLALCDLFAGSPWIVELEKDLSARKQPLDIAILRRGPGEFAGRLPDGLEPLADHNLLSYKSLREPLDDWTLKEATGHYVNYRKQVSPRDELLPEEAFALFGISTRFPQKLAAQVALQRVQQGVYEVVRGTDRIRIIVLSEIPQVEHNSLWLLFSGLPEPVRYGARHYEPHTPDMSSILNRLFENYNLEGLSMPYTMQDFRRDVVLEYLSEVSPEERIELLRAVAPEEPLQGLPPEERLKGLPPEERLKGLSPRDIEAYLKKLHETEGPTRPRKSSKPPGGGGRQRGS